MNKLQCSECGKTDSYMDIIGKEELPFCCPTCRQTYVSKLVRAEPKCFHGEEDTTIDVLTNVSFLIFIFFVAATFMLVVLNFVLVFHFGGVPTS